MNGESNEAHYRKVPNRNIKIKICEGKKSAYTTNIRRNESHTSFGASNRLAETEEKRQVAMNAVVPFEFTRSMDTLPRRRDLEENTLLLDTNGFVKGNKFLRLDVTTSARLPNYVYRVIQIN